MTKTSHLNAFMGTLRRYIYNIGINENFILYVGAFLTAPIYTPVRSVYAGAPAQVDRIFPEDKHTLVKLCKSSNQVDIRSHFIVSWSDLKYLVQR